jgi:hypothetical protein
MPLLIAAVYDGLLGLLFLFFAAPLFRALGIESAADPVYIQLAAGLIAIMGFGFYLAWRDPLLNGDIILMGAVFKVFYIVLAVITQIQGQIPHPLFLVFAAADVVFLIVFIAFLRDVSAVRGVLNRFMAGSAPT